VYLQRNECGCIEQEKTNPICIEIHTSAHIFWAGPSQVHCTS